MGISEKKMQIVINNYFEQECDVNTSIREAFEKGFKIGAKKTTQQKWIPCTPETMPEKDGRYVCTYTYDGKKDVFMFRFEDGDFLVPWYVDTITAWYKPLDPWEGDING